VAFSLHNLHPGGVPFHINAHVNKKSQEINITESIGYSQFFLTLKHTNIPTATDGGMDGWTDWWVDGCKDWWLVGWMDG
jgi:hypothetical protein